MFSAYCLQNHEYFQTGRNSKSKTKCIEEIVEFLTEGEEDPDVPWSEISNQEILDIFEVEVRKHKEVI